MEENITIDPADLYRTYDYSIPYSEAELKYVFAEITGNVIDTEFDFDVDTVAIKRTENSLLRWWGGFCADLAMWALKQNERWGDYYMLIDEEYTGNKYAELREIIVQGGNLEN